MKYWRKKGIGRHKIAAFASIETQDRTILREALFWFGGVYAGISLPLSAQKQRVWEVPPGGARGAGEPGSWGGHAVPIVAADPRGLTVVTWGRLQRMSWAFWQTYGDEAYAVLSMDYVDDKAARRTGSTSQPCRKTSPPSDGPARRAPCRSPASTPPPSP